MGSNGLYCLVSQMKTLSHANLNPLIGVCIDHLHIAIINYYCAKGSLQDVLESSTVKLDRNFMLSFATDIVLVSSNLFYSACGCFVPGRFAPLS